MKHDLEHTLGTVLLFLGHEAIHHPWQAAIAVLLAVIWVIRRTSGGETQAQAPVIVKTGGGLLLVVIAAVGAFVYFTRSKAPAQAAATPTPTITQKTINRTIIQHVTHVAAQSHTGLYVLVGIIAIFVIGMVIHLINRLTGG